MIQVLPIQRKMSVYSQNWHFALCCSYRHYCSPSNVYKFNMVLTSQNLKKCWYCLYLLYRWTFLCTFIKQFLPFQRFSITPLLASLPNLKNFLYPSIYAHFWEVLYTLNKGRSPIPLKQGGRGGGTMQENCAIFLMKVFYNLPYSNFLLFYYIKIHPPSIEKKWIKRTSLGNRNLFMTYSCKIYDKIEGKNTCSCISVYSDVLNCRGGNWKFWEKILKFI